MKSLGKFIRLYHLALLVRIKGSENAPRSKQSSSLFRHPSPEADHTNLDPNSHPSLHKFLQHEYILTCKSSEAFSDYKA